MGNFISAFGNSVKYLFKPGLVKKGKSLSQSRPLDRSCVPWEFRLRFQYIVADPVEASINSVQSALLGRKSILPTCLAGESNPPFDILGDVKWE